MTNKNKALTRLTSLIDKNSFEGWTQDSINGYKTAMATTKDLIELASKPDWYYPSKGEFPETKKYIRVITHNDVYDEFLFYDINSVSNSNTSLVINKELLLKYKAWTYLPTYKEY